MSEQNPQDKKYKTEWSFSFEKLGETISSFFNSLGEDAELQNASYHEAADGALSAVIELNGVVGQAALKALEDPTNLFEAEITYAGELDYEVSGEGEKVIRIGQHLRGGSMGSQVRAAIGKHENLRWAVGISPSIPVRLEVNGRVGQAHLDLTGLRLTEVKLGGGLGETFLTLPATGQRYPVKIEGGVGATHVSIAEGAALNLKIEGGVGEITLELPENAAVRLEVEGGIGGAEVPKRLTRIKDSGGLMGQSGVWESEGFALASEQVVIHYRGGVGALKVR